MRIGRAHILAFLSLVTALSATGAAYQFYVKERLRELAEHQERKEQLQKRIGELQTTFTGTKPSAMLNAWAGVAQPWEESVLSRTKFFELGDEMKSESVVPEGKIPRFYYADVYPDKVKSLQDEAFRNHIQFYPDFGVPDPSGISGTNPSAQQVSAWLTRIDTYTAVAKLLIEANPVAINQIALWPPRQGPRGPSGEVQFLTVGLNFSMNVKEFVQFLDDLRRQRRFFHVDHFWISNTNLRMAGAPLNVQMLLSQAQFKEREQVAGATGPGAAPIDAQSAFTPAAFGQFANLQGFGGVSGAGNAAEPKVGIIRRILNLFPF